MVGYDCTRFNNYSPHKRHITGLKYNPYVLTHNGAVFANGNTYNGGGVDGTGPSPARFEYPPALNVPGCGHCCG